MWETFNNLPSDESEEGSDDEDTVKECKSNKKSMKCFHELFSPQDNNCHNVSWQSGEDKDIVDYVDNT